jgi:acylphosphatase
MIPISGNYFAESLPNGRVNVYTIGDDGRPKKVVHCLNEAEAILWVDRAENTPYKLAR